MSAPALALLALLAAAPPAPVPTPARAASEADSERAADLARCAADRIAPEAVAESRKSQATLTEELRAWSSSSRSRGGRRSSRELREDYR